VERVSPYRSRRLGGDVAPTRDDPSAEAAHHERAHLGDAIEIPVDVQNAEIME
jgi:hypothetical protein